MEEFIPIDMKQFLEIRESEKEILQFLRSDCNLVHDSYGDPVIQNGQFVVDLNNPVIPNILRVPQTNMFSQFINNSTILDTLSQDTINGYFDVFGIDDSIINKKNLYNVVPMGYFVDGIYNGFVWTFKSPHFPKFVAMYGIRSSLLNTLTGKRGIAKRIVSSMLRLYPFSKIIVPWPLPVMQKVLSQFGFREFDYQEHHTYSQFMDGIVIGVPIYVGN